MIPYFALLFGCSFLAMLAQGSKLSRGASLALWAAVVLLMGLFAGLRGDFVGVDTPGYIGRFDYLVATKTFWDSDSSAEPAYKVLLALARILSTSPTSHLIITSFTATLLYITAIRRLSPVPAISLFVFIAFGFFVFHMNGLRQGLALGVYMHALPAMLQGRPLRYVSWVLVATMFHSSAILTLPLYFLFRLGFSFWSFGVLLTVSVILVPSFNLVVQFAGLANERYALYGQRTETGGAMLALFNQILALIFIVGRPLVRPEWRNEYNKYLMMMLLGAMVFGIVTLTGSYVEITRMALYFTVSMVFLWALLLRSIGNKTVRSLGIFLVVVVGSLFFMIYLDQIGGYTPYVMK